MKFEKILRHLENECLREGGPRNQRACAIEKLLERKVKKMLEWSYCVGTTCATEGPTIRAINSVSMSIYNDNKEGVIDFIELVTKK